MDRIVRDVELSGEYEYVREQQVPEAGETRTDALARSARYLARDVEASAVVVASESGFTARKAAQYRPGVPIVASTPDHRVRRQLSLSCGVVPRHSPMLSLEDGDRIDTLIDQSVDTAIDTGIVESGDTVVVVSGMMTDFGSTDTSNTLKVHVAAETAASGRGVVNGRAVGTLHRITDGDLTDVPEGAIAALPEDFDDEFRGDTSKLAGIVHARLGMTGYPAIVARELGLPMISGAELPDDLEDGETITLDGNRGVIYRGEVTRR